MNLIDKYATIHQSYSFCVGTIIGVMVLAMLTLLLYVIDCGTIFLVSIIAPPLSAWHTMGHFGIWSTFLATSVGCGPFIAVMPFSKQSVLSGGADRSVFKIRTWMSSIGERYPLERAGFVTTLLVVAIMSAVILGQGVDLHR